MYLLYNQQYLYNFLLNHFLSYKQKFDLYYYFRLKFKTTCLILVYPSNKIKNVRVTIIIKDKLKKK